MIEKYYKLLDPEWNGMIVHSVVKDEPNAIPKISQFEKVGGWIETGIMSLYWFDFSKYYGEYEEITKEEALKAITDSKYRF